MPTPLNSVFTPDNGRVYWACQAVLFKQRQSTLTSGTDKPKDGELLHGVQSIGVSSSFERTPYSDFGRFQQVYGSYGKQVFTITIDRVIDGATEGVGRGKPFYYPASNPSNYILSHMLNPANIGADGFTGSLRNYDITLLYGGDSFRYVGSGGDDPADVPPFEPSVDSPVSPPKNWESGPGPEPVVPSTGYSNPQAASKDLVSQTTYRSCLLTEVNYSIPVTGPMIESLTFVTGVATHNDNTKLSDYTALDDYPEGGHVDTIATIQGKHIDTARCELPLEVLRAFDTGETKYDNASGENRPIYGLQSIEMGASIDYSDLFDYGEFGGTRGASDAENWPRQNFMKQVTLPVAVTASFTGVIRDQYYGSQAWEWQLQDQTLDNTTTGALSIYKWEREIAIVSMTENHLGAELYTQWLLGNRNYLTDISYSGGDTGGGNVEATLSYQNECSDFIAYKSNTLYANPTPADIY